MDNGYVYVILNKITGKMYIGSTINLDKRIKTHFSALKNNTHHNIYLQRSFDKNGLDSFEVSTIYYGVDYKKIEEEKINESYENLYNVSKKASGGDLISYHPNRDLIITKIKKSLEERYIDESVRKSYARYGFENPNWKGGIVYKCECGNIKAKTAKHCSTCRDRTSYNNPFYGKKHTEETIEKLRKAASGNKSKQAIKVIIDDVVYESYTDASKKLNCCVATILNRINSDKFPNYKRL